MVKFVQRELQELRRLVIKEMGTPIPTSRLSLLESVGQEGRHENGSSNRWLLRVAIRLMAQENKRDQLEIGEMGQGEEAAQSEVREMAQKVRCRVGKSRLWRASRCLDRRRSTI
jgi:hypothetical protein